MSQGYIKSGDGKYLYTINGTECSLRGVFENSSELVIPENIDGKIVSVVSATVFEAGKEYIESVVFPNTVKYLEYKSFVKMKKLKRVVLSSSMSMIPMDSFVYCDVLEEIVIPKGVFSVQNTATHDCANLKRVVIFEDNLILTESSFADVATRTSKNEFHYPYKKLDGTPDYRYNPVYEVAGDIVSGKRRDNVTIFVHRGSATERIAKQCGYTTAIIEESE